MVDILFGPYFLLEIIMMVLCCYWAITADAREKDGWTGLFAMRTVDDYRRRYGDRTPY